MYLRKVKNFYSLYATPSFAPVPPIKYGLPLSLYMCIRMDPLVACVRVAPVSGQDDHLEPLKELVVQLFGQYQPTLQRVLKSCSIRILLS